MLVADSTMAHQFKHLTGVHSLNTALSMAYHHYFVDSQLIDCDKQRAHGRVKRVGDCPPGIFYDFYVPVAQAKGGRQKLDKAGIHAGNYCNALIGIFRSHEFLIALCSYKLSVMLYYLLNHGNRSG